jgi:hypothetical protein
MRNRLRRFQKLTLVLGAAAATFLCVPSAVHAQSSTPQSSASQDRQAVPAPPDRQTVPGDDITRRDLAQFDQFLDGHRETADQLRKTPSLIDDPQYLQSHPELNAYLQDHTSVKQEISTPATTTCAIVTPPGRIVMPTVETTREIATPTRETWRIETWRISTGSSTIIVKLPNRFAKTRPC